MVRLISFRGKVIDKIQSNQLARCLVSYSKGHSVTTVNLITPPDRIFNTNQKMLLIHPNTELKSEFQKTILEHIDSDLDLYIFDVTKPTADDIDWLLVATSMVDKIIIDVDNCDSKTRMLAGYIIAKSITYWLTNNEESVYNHISKNRIYNLDNFQIGGYSV